MVGSNEMIDLEAYPIKPELFLSRPVCYSIKLRDLVNESKKSKMKDKNGKTLDVYCFKKIFLFAFTFFIILSVILLLIASGDVVQNPGPVYSVDKFRSETFHKNDEKFRKTAGSQCACNSINFLGHI